MYDPDGDIGPEKSCLNMKFTEEARFSFGCAVIELDGGAKVGRRCTPFVYSGQWILTIEEMDRHINAEVRRVQALPGVSSPWVTGHRSTNDGIFENDCASRLKGIGKKLLDELAKVGITTVQDIANIPSEEIPGIVAQLHGISLRSMQKFKHTAQTANHGSYVPRLVDHKKTDNPYESLFGTTWRDQIVKSTGMKSSVCITTMVEHIIQASPRVMAKTKHADDWVFMHDALSQMTCTSTIAWMKEMGYYRRWVLPELGLNWKTRYAGRPVGNSPEPGIAR
ncbi:hypothetical protein H257_07849 [Aphanomyces astaci]|uniref:Uncharacterized protein n=1 Tax=Aphanomyces astaci TaxID=112090 RepID=W4GJN3_APHAT|nr:hypothetical protein H257_07849 [Aphanomyces astaci]ETV79113.1 hypothetical protein H257_07849 [Aphanomyces astaci]|eukprot:XP_009831832.1 hypothetical protein H257_07849 [Aphanomyces astaci]